MTGLKKLKLTSFKFEIVHPLWNFTLFLPTSSEGFLKISQILGLEGRCLNQDLANIRSQLRRPNLEIQNKLTIIEFGTRQYKFTHPSRFFPIEQ